MYIVNIYKQKEGKSVLEGAMFFDEKEMSVAATKALPKNKKGVVNVSPITVEDFFSVVGKEMNK